LKKLNPKTYMVKKINFQNIEPSKIFEDSIWTSANVLEDFSQPWSNADSPKTKFLTLHNDQFLFLRFDVEDNNVLIHKESEDKMNVAQSDRVEIFYRENKKMDSYFCLEVDPNGRVLDYAASFYRKFNNNWVWPKDHILTTGKKYLNGYKVYITLSIQSLRDLRIMRKNKIQVGIYRGDCKSLPSRKQKEAEINWISWVTPKTERSDFHVSSSFGILTLE